MLQVLFTAKLLISISSTYYLLQRISKLSIYPNRKNSLWIFCIFILFTFSVFLHFWKLLSLTTSDPFKKSLLRGFHLLNNTCDFLIYFNVFFTSLFMRNKRKSTRLRIFPITIFAFYFFSELLIDSFILLDYCKNSFNNSNFIILEEGLVRKIFLSNALNFVTLFFLAGTHPSQFPSHEKSGLVKKTVNLKNYSLLGQLFFTWMSKLLFKVGRKSIRFENYPELNRRDSVTAIEGKFKRKWLSILKQEKNNKISNKRFKTDSFYFWKLITFDKNAVFNGFVFKLVHDLSEIYLNRWVDIFISTKLDPNVKERKIAMWSLIVLYLAFQTICELSLNVYYRICLMSGIRIKQSLSLVLYKKFIGSTSSDIGQITNLISSDIENISSLFGWIHGLWSYPLQFFFNAYFLWDLIGNSFFASLAISLVIYLPVNYYTQITLNSIYKLFYGAADKTMSYLKEFIRNLRILRLYGWSDSFVSKIETFKFSELQIWKRIVFFDNFNGSFWSVIPSMMKVLIVSGFLMTNKFEEVYLSGKKKGTLGMIIMYIQGVRFPLNMLPMVVAMLYSAKISGKRIVDNLRSFYSLEKVSSKTSKSKKKSISNPDSNNKEEKNILTFSDKSFYSLSPSKKIKLKNFSIERNKIYTVIGPTASGKSVFLSGVADSLEPSDDIISSDYSMSICRQSSWVLNGTIRDNILFGEEMIEERYLKVIEVTCMVSDLQEFPEKDLTYVGSSGQSLSGGQQQRLNIARALYSPSEVAILDDCLSALDSVVALRVLNEAIIKNPLKKTFVIATQNKELIKKSDFCIYMKNLEVVDFDKPSKILSNESVQKLYEDIEENEEEDLLVLKDDDTLPALDLISFDSIVTEENREIFKETKIGSSTSYIPDWIERIGGYSFIIPFFLFKALVFATMRLMDKSYNSPLIYGIKSTSSFIAFQTGALILIAFFEFMAQVFLYKINTYAFLSFFLELLRSVNLAKILDLDSYSSGAIITRFTNDLPDVNNRLIRPLKISIDIGMNFLVNIIVNGVDYPMTLWFSGFNLVSLYLFSRIYTKQLVKIKTTYNRAVSSVHDNIENTLMGEGLITPMKKVGFMIKRHIQYLDECTKVNFTFVSIVRWMSVLFTFTLHLAMVPVFYYTFINDGLKDNFRTVIIFICVINQNLKYLIQFYSEFMTYLSSMPRLKEILKLPQEKKIKGEEKEGGEVKGEILIKNFTLRVGKNELLKSINLRIKPGDNIGVVGRTGAGKTTFINSLLKMMDGSEGSILLDGEDIDDLTIDSLRKKISIIPQNPTMFEESLRYNIDPLNSVSDEEIDKLIETCSLSRLGNNDEANIKELKIEQDGKNISVGEKQLICLARALLRKTKVIVLDEATSSLDKKMDNLIQNIIRKSFKEATVITVAHRISTILDYDKILVLDKGKVVEFDSPSNLINNEKSFFNKFHHKS